jgi:hypothetical protein
MLIEKANSMRHMDTLSRIMIHACCSVSASDRRRHPQSFHDDFGHLTRLNPTQWREFIDLADSNHVLMRVLTVLQTAAVAHGNLTFKEACETALAAERARIERAVERLQEICKTLESNGCQVAVIKSLDHWPDLGSDLDLYTTADPECVQEVMLREFHASRVARSWGDRLAHKWNFKVPGLPELVEIHVGLLGQTGEHARLARRIVERRIIKTVGGRQFHVPAPEERLVISALQRVYRHFYFRLCDIIDVALLLRTEPVDFQELRKAAESAGIWQGVAMFLALIRNYVETYGGSMALPVEVTAAAEGSANDLQLKGQFLRMSKLSATGLYGGQCVRAALHRDLHALVRLPLLPPLALSALIAYQLTGNDKGIW